MRRNLFKQPSFETVTTDWTASGTFSTTTSEHYIGTKAGQLVSTGATPSLSATVPAVASKQYTFSIYAKGNTPGGVVKVEYYNGATLLGTATGSTFTNLGAWTRQSVTFTTPASTTSVKAIVAASVTWTTGTTVYLDAALLEEGALDAYFDGATSGYAWDDVPGNSTSSSLVSVNPGLQARLEVETTPGTWTDITGPTANISFTFDDSNAASLGAEVLDADLDPLVSTDLRLGKPVRVRGLDVRTNDFSVLYTGTIDNLSVKRNPREQRKVSISLTASNNVTYLSGQTDPRGVGTINELRWLVTGVPFNINGATTPLGSGTVVSKNENASIWDNVLTTRDSVLGYAWVDKNNVLNAWDHAVIDTSVKAVIGPDTYTDLDIDFNLEQIINSVTVNWMRYNIGTETSSSVPYGPYTDTASISQWGTRSATFTVQGATEVEANIAAFANDVLSRNATAEIRPKSAVVRISKTHDLHLAHVLDLNSYVDVVYHDGTTTKTMRVTGIKHDIAPDSWTVEYEFSLPNGVTQPSVAPTSPTAYVPDGSIGTGQLDPVLSDTITDAATNAQNALNNAASAMNFAQTRNKVYYQTTMPSGGTYAIGDIWYDTDDGNKIYVHNGTTFVAATSSYLITPNGKLTISPTGIIGQDTGGATTFSLNAATGAVVMKGSLTSGSDVTGATITASSTGVIQTESTTARGIKMNSTGFTAYDGSGSPTFTITASTGAVAMKGSLTSGSSIVGATIDSTSTITGATIQTTSTAARGVKLLSDGLHGFNSSGTETFFLSAVTGGLNTAGLSVNGSGNFYDVSVTNAVTAFGGLATQGGNITTNGGNISLSAGTYNGNNFSAFQAGRKTTGSLASGASATLTVTGLGFGSVPSVFVTPTNVSVPDNVVVTVSSVTSGGFSINVKRVGGATGAVDVSWIATTASAIGG